VKQTLCVRRERGRKWAPRLEWRRRAAGGEKLRGRTRETQRGTERETERETGRERDLAPPYLDPGALCEGHEAGLEGPGSRRVPVVALRGQL
jgi:hypothetical protein